MWPMDLLFNLREIFLVANFSSPDEFQPTLHKDSLGEELVGCQNLFLILLNNSIKYVHKDPLGKVKRIQSSSYEGPYHFSTGGTCNDEIKNLKNQFDKALFWATNACSRVQISPLDLPNLCWTRINFSSHSNSCNILLILYLLF